MTVLRLIGIAAMAIGLAACGGGNSGSGGSSASGARTIGSETAPLTLVEYGSVACGGCAVAHLESWPVLKPDYIDTGRVQFELREMITGSQPIAMTGFAIANCVADDRYFDAIDLLFRQQNALVQAMRSRGGARAQFVAIAATLGMSENDFNACVSDQAVLDAIMARHEAAGAAGINRTPTYFLNDQLLDSRREGGREIWTLGGEIVLNANGEPIEASYATFGPLLDAVEAGLAE